MKRIAKCPYCHKNTQFVKLGTVFSEGKSRQRLQCKKCGKLCYIPPTQHNPKPIDMHIVDR